MSDSTAVRRLPVRMRFLSCLSQNVSVVVAENEINRPRLRQNAKDKKRRSNNYERRPFASHNADRKSSPQCAAGSDENVRATVYKKNFTHPRQDINNVPLENPETPRLQALSVNTATSTTTTVPSKSFMQGPYCPLPPVPTDMNDISHECETTTDYLPSYIVCSPLMTDSEEEDTTATSVRPAIPVWKLNPGRIVDYSVDSDSGVTCSTCGTNESGGTTSPVSYGSGSQAFSEGCSSASQNSHVISGLNQADNFNQAFVQSTGSLPLRAHDSNIVSVSAYLTNNSKNSHKLNGPRISNITTDNRFRPQTSNKRRANQAELFKKNVINAPAHDDIVDEQKDGEDADVDVETVSQSSSASEFLGCMSFGVSHLLRKDLDDWYHLLTEEVGRKKHLQAHSKPRPVLTTRTYQNVPQINKAFDGQDRVMITMTRGKNGFGFSFVDEFPPKVGRVDRASPAEHAGVKKGDFVIRINGQNVSRSTCEGVAHMVKKANPSELRLELLRDSAVSTTTEVTATGTRHPHYTSPYNKRGVGTSTDNLYESLEDKSYGDRHKENRAIASLAGSYEEDYYTDDEMSYSRSILPSHQGITSTPRLFVGPGHKAVNTQAPHPLSKHESIHRLMSLELDYIDFMRYGIERYSRPLRHSILSAHNHMTVFQNVEKLVTISEYHIKQMQENNSSINSDTDDSQSSESSMFPNSVALIYHSKIHMLSQAYEAYASGLSKSNALLRELRKNQDFMNFIREPDYRDEQCPENPSVSAFINRPVLHIQELYSVLSEVFSATALHSPDFANLQQIVIKLTQCISVITGLSTAGRVQSLDSLTSSQGMTGSQTNSSGKGSLASLSSTCSSSEADVRGPLIPNSAASIRFIDRDMRQIMEALVFGPDVQAFQLVQDGRHLIYRGDIYRYSKGLWFKSQLILFSDIFLVASEESDGSLCVTNNPVRVQDLAGIEVNRKYASEFVLYLHDSTTVPRRHQSSSSRASTERIKTITLRAPSTQEKFMWKALLEQRVTSFSGSRLHHYGSMKDIAHVKTGIIL